MSSWHVAVTTTAERDLTEAVLYIRDALGNSQAANRLLDELEGCAAGLSEQPTRRPLVRDERLSRMGYRWAPVGGHMAFFTMDEKGRTVYIERLLFGRSDWRAVL